MVKGQFWSISRKSDQHLHKCVSLFFNTVTDPVMRHVLITWYSLTLDLTCAVAHAVEAGEQSNNSIRNMSKHHPKGMTKK